MDWLVENHSYIIVAPKLDTRLDEIKRQNEDIEVDECPTTQFNAGRRVTVDYFAMLQRCLHTDFLYAEIDNLVQINWRSKEVPISQTQDWLSPLLIVKFLNVLKSIVRKGLKKSYYPVTQNLQGKIKGKILVGTTIKQNVLKNRFTHTVCSYEEFGIDHTENRLLKKAFQFACSYIDNHSEFFGATGGFFKELANYCRPAFVLVGTEVSVTDMKHYKPNHFFKEYTEGIPLAKLILKRYAYTISNTVKETVTTPPYWIDMPKLFELYAYNFLKSLFPKPGEVLYHPKTYGNELDFLIASGNLKMVVDAKYKPVYLYGKNHTDMRQLSGYARLDFVYNKLGLTTDDDRVIDTLIVYPDIEGGCTHDETRPISQIMQPIKGYRRTFKIGIKLPVQGG